MAMIEEQEAWTLASQDDRFCGHCGHLVDFQRYKGFCVFCQEQFPESDWEPLKGAKPPE